MSTEERNEKENDEDLEFLKKVTLELRKRFDTVQVICTADRGEDAGVVVFDYGYGNWFTRYGSVLKWAKE